MAREFVKHRDAEGTDMATLTGTRTRTITGHLANLLEYPNWLIERDVDFTHCKFDGNFDDSQVGCVNCQYEAGCKWLTGLRNINPATASVSELTGALRVAIGYVGTRQSAGHQKNCSCEACEWLCSARQLLRSQSR